MKKMLIILSIVLSACSRESINIDCERAKLINTGIRLTNTVQDNTEQAQKALCLTVAFYAMKEEDIEQIAKANQQEYEQIMDYLLKRCDSWIKEDNDIPWLAKTAMEAAEFSKKQSHCFK